MRSTRTLINAVFLSTLLALPVQPAEAAFTKHYDESLLQVTENGLFGVELVIHGGEVRMGVNRLDLIVHDTNDRDVVGARLDVTPWMPEMGHGVAEKAVVSERGGGLYTADNVVFSMTGQWELRIAVAAGDAADSVTFAFPDVGAHGHKAPAGQEEGGERADLSRSVLSREGHLRVSYTTDPEMIPLNRIHRWLLSITTPGGKEVRDARILIVGDMPEHGHGLPTRPEASSGGADGTYVVNGMKFNMPGRWILTFDITAGTVRDSATFTVDIH